MTDRCAACFEPLKPAPLGGRYACECSNGYWHAGYWSEAIPDGQHTKKANLVSKHGRPTLHYYGYLKGAN